MAVVNVEEVARLGIVSTLFNQIFDSKRQWVAFKVMTQVRLPTSYMPAKNGWPFFTGNTKLRLPGIEEFTGNDWKTNKVNRKQLYEYIRDNGTNKPISLTLIGGLKFDNWNDPLHNNPFPTSPGFTDLPQTLHPRRQTKPQKKNSSQRDAFRFKLIPVLGLDQLQYKVDEASFSDISVLGEPIRKIATGGTSSTRFIFMESGNPRIFLKTSVVNTLKQATINGVTNTTETGGEREGGVEISARYNHKKKFDPVKGVGREVEKEIGGKVWASLKAMWKDVESIEFSTEDQTIQTTEVEQNVTRNLDELPRYDKTVTNDSGNVYQFEVGEEYIAHIIYIQTEISSTAKSDIKVGGYNFAVVSDTGTLYPETLLLSEAIKAGNENMGPKVLGYDKEVFGKFDDTGLYIDFSGKATFRTTVHNEFSVTYTHSPSRSDIEKIIDEDPAMLSNSLQSNTTTYNLKNDVLFGSGIGVSLTPETSKDGHAIIIGGPNPNHIINASVDGTHEYREFRSSFINGNDNSDVLILNRSSSDNSIETKGGDDKVVASSSQNYCDTGSGDDRYVIKSGTHVITTGEGFDFITLRPNGESSFIVKDYDPIKDSIRFRSSRARSITTNVQEDYADSNYPAIKFLDGDKVIGELALTDFDRDDVTNCVLLNQREVSSYVINKISDNTITTRELLETLADISTKKITQDDFDQYPLRRQRRLLMNTASRLENFDVNPRTIMDSLVARREQTGLNQDSFFEILFQTADTFG